MENEPMTDDHTVIITDEIALIDEWDPDEADVVRSYVADLARDSVMFLTENDKVLAVQCSVGLIHCIRSLESIILDEFAVIEKTRRPTLVRMLRDAADAIERRALN